MQGRFLPSPKWTFHKWVRHTVSSVFYIALFFNSIRVGGQKPSTADLMQLCSTNSLYQPWSTTELRHAHPIFLKVTHKLQKIPPQQMWPISVIPGDVCLLRREWGRRSQVHLSVLHDAMRMWRKECGLSPLQSQDCYLLGSFNSAGHVTRQFVSHEEISKLGTTVAKISISIWLRRLPYLTFTQFWDYRLFDYPVDKEDWTQEME